MKQTAIKRLGLGLLFSGLVIGLSGSVAWAANSVVIESKTVAKADSLGVQVGIFSSNDVDIQAYVLPLKILTVSTGAWIKKAAIKAVVGARFDGKLVASRIYNGYLAEDRAVNGGVDCPGGNGVYSWSDTLSHSVGATPIGIMISCLDFGSAPLPAGTDGITPSFRLLLDIQSTVGEFDIDSTCIDPANTILFVDNVTSEGIMPSFTKGAIHVSAAAVEYLGGDGVPRGYNLEQNYPNPFNASTIIKFNTKHDGNVRLDVYNVLGQQVRTLVNEFRHFGPQSVDWDATDASGRPVPSGMYFYRIATDDFTAVKKMVLLK